jgi:hypothetical protein
LYSSLGDYLAKVGVAGSNPVSRYFWIGFGSSYPDLSKVRSAGALIVTDWG